MRLTSISCFIFFYQLSLNVVNGSNRTIRQTPCVGAYECASGQCIQEYDVCNGLSQCEDGTDELPSACDCGERTEIVRVSSNAPGVRYAHQGSHPWHAGIYRKRENHPDILLCSGVLIYNDIILTAASCVIDPVSQLTYLTSGLAVGLGKLSKDLHVDEPKQQIFEVSNVVIREYYEGFYKHYVNNLAIVKLKKSIARNHYVKPVCLWAEKQLPPGVTKGSIVGWGLQFSGTYGINLREATTELITVQKCIRSYGDTLYRKYLTADKFCIIFDQGVGVRAEDVGGPVTIYHNGRHYLYGVISKQFGTQYGLGSLTRKHLDWIKTTTYKLKQTDICLKSKHFNCVVDGACINVKKLCDGTKDCKDGSDEDPQVCTDQNSHRGGNKCLLPERIENFNVLKCGSAGGCDNLDSAPSNSRYQITCPEGYGFAAPNTKAVPIVCNDGVWIPSLDDNRCLKLCKLEGHKSLELTCTYLGEEVSCHDLLKPNTHIAVECKRHYKKNRSVNFITNTHCRRDGIINNELSLCEPVCGKPYDISSIQTLISNGKPLKYAKYPWHIALYWKEGENGMQQYEYKCGGTLLDANKVLTAAHCVWSGNDTVPENILGIASGKLYRNWPNHAGEIWVQRVEVRNIILPKYYNGAKNQHSQDIAILILDKDIKLSDNTMPACLDLDQTEGGVPSDQLGHVIGWGSTSGTELNLSDVLKESWMKYMELNTCRKEFERSKFTEYLHPDKYCALYINGSGSQIGDSGGGMTFTHGDLHYVYGVVSLKKRGQDEFAVFTNVLDVNHAGWIKKILSQ